MEFRFGMAGELGAELTAVAFCGTVLFLNVFDALTSFLERSVGNSRIYSSMIQKIYSELMSTGFVSVMFSFYEASVSSSDKRDRVFTTLDFCGYFLFCVAIFHVMHGIYIIVISLASAKQYDEYHRCSVASTLRGWNNLTKDQSWLSKVKAYGMTFLYIPGFSLRSKSEFKVLYSLFRHTYMLPPNFHFGQYLAGCLERYSLRIVTIGATGWICMVLLCLANLLRVKYGSLHTWKCEGFETSGYGEEEVEEDDDEFVRPRLSKRCQRIQLQLFFGCGLIINAFVLFIYVLGRMYTLRLLAEAGVTELSDFQAYLTLEEKIKAEKQKVLREASSSKLAGQTKIHRQTINMDTFKSNFARRKSGEATAVSASRSPSILSSAIKSVTSKLVASGPKEEGLKAEDNVLQAEKTQSTPQQTARVNRNSVKSTSRNSRLTKRKSRGSTHRNTTNRTSTIGRVGGMLNDVSVTKSCIAQYRAIKLRASIDSRFESGQSHRKMKSLFRSRLRERESKTVQPSGELKYSEDFSFIYLFGSPVLYFRAVEICIALNSLYLSLWVLNFITIAHTYTNGEGEHWPEWIWQPILIGPLLFSIPVIGEIVKTASLLTAIAELEIDVMGLIIEAMERKKCLYDELKKAICDGFVNTFNEECTPASFRPLFDTHDTKEQDTLDYGQVRNLLINLNQHISDERFGHLMEILDYDRNQEISFEEFKRFLFESSQRRPLTDEQEGESNDECNDDVQQHPSGRKIEPETTGVVEADYGGNRACGQVHPLSCVGEQECERSSGEDEKAMENNNIGDEIEKFIEE